MKIQKKKKIITKCYFTYDDGGDCKSVPAFSAVLPSFERRSLITPSKSASDKWPATLFNTVPTLPATLPAKLDASLTTALITFVG